MGAPGRFVHGRCGDARPFFFGGLAMKPISVPALAVRPGKRWQTFPSERALALAASAALLAIAAGCAAPSGPAADRGAPPAERAAAFSFPVPKPAVSVGDWWVYRGSEGGASGQPVVLRRTVARVDGDRIELRQAQLDPATGKPAGAERTRRANLANWHLEPTIRSSGEIQALLFPLTPGKAWDYEYSLGTGADAVTTYRIRARVAGQETVRVAAGSFPAAKVVHEGQWSRWVLQRGEAKQLTGAVRSTWWYAPAVSSWVSLEVELFRADGSVELSVRQELESWGRARPEARPAATAR